MFDNNFFQITVIIIVLYLLYKRLFITEQMNNNLNIDKYIREIYQVNTESLKNLVEISKNLYNEKSLILPTDISVNGKFNYLPKGVIVAFNNTKAPKGWVLCDGNNGTPDLRNRFIYGKNNGKNINQTGGSENHKLTINELSSHSHSSNYTNNHSHNSFLVNGSGGTTYGYSPFMFLSRNFISKNGRMSDSGNHRHNIHNTGGNQPHNNMPPYVVLTWIMKL